MNIKELRNLKVNTEVYELLGWVNTVRDHGGLTFIDLRDYDSFIQLVIDENINEIEKIKSEYYISISGIFKKRDPGLENKKQEFGDMRFKLPL
jgi:aspartyl-tRNA synthetase